MVRLFTGLAVLSLALGAFSTAGAADDTGKKKLDAEALFKKLDTNGDNKLSKEEFAKFTDKLKEKLADKGGDKAGKMLDGLFDKLDKNKDGFLSLEEFKAFGGGKGRLKGKAGNKKPANNNN